MTDREGELSSVGRPSTRVIEAIASAEGVEPVDLDPPLHEVVDLDALDALFAPASGVPRPVGRVEFEYGDYRVTVTGDESVAVERTDSTSAEP